MYSEIGADKAKAVEEQQDDGVLRSCWINRTAMTTAKPAARKGRAKGTAAKSKRT